MIAALYVEAKGCYAGVPDVELWDEARDARLYPGPHAVVAHPPCARWCKLAAVVEARYPQHRQGEDGGVFAAALAAVRRWGGVLEHPAYSKAWPRYGLLNPPHSGGWVRDLHGGWTCHVEQGLYGHPASKATWLYAFGLGPPSMRWGSADSTALCSYCETNSRPRARIGDWSSNGDTDYDTRRRLSPKEASATPTEFRDILISMARSVQSNLDP